MLRAHTRKWGNSLGIVIPKEAVRELELKPHEEIILDIQKKSGTVLKELFGAIKWKKHPRELLHEARKEFESKYGL